MRKLYLQMQTSLDLFVCRPNRELDWVERGFDDEVLAWMGEAFKTTEAMVLGRVAFIEQQGYWPTDAANDDPLTPMINAWDKVVFSKTLADAEVTWPNSRLESGDIMASVRRLKEQDGGDILVSGGAMLAQTLSGAGLVDEYRLVMHPLALGEGLPVFSTQVDLELRETHRMANGVVALVYTPTAK